MPEDSAESRLAETELMFAIAEGNSAALGKLYTRFAPRLFGIAVKILESEAEAQDVLHQVFIEVWERAGEFDPERGTLLTWLSVRTRSRAIDRRRRAMRHLPESETFAPPSLLGTPDEAQTSLDLEAIAVRRSLAALSPEQLQIILRAYFFGETCRQMSTALGLPLGTVKSRMAAALEKLRALLGPA